MFWTRLQPSHPRSTPGNPFEIVNRFMGAAPVAPRRAAGSPAFNLWANEDGAVLTSELPGTKLEDMEISVSGKTVTVKGSRKAEELGEKMTFVRHERVEGNFERAFELPYAIETAKVEATLRNGVLTISLPRAENEKPRKISISE